MEDPLPLHVCHVRRLSMFINRSHSIIHSIALAFLVYYRAYLIFQDPRSRGSPLLPWLLVFASELLLSFIWLLGRGFGWRPVTRTVFPERLPEDDSLPAIDVFICTVDPKKEPTVEVMNTVLSAMALDYPPEKLHVYLSDDGGSPLTLHGMRQAWRFAREWLPFCRRYGIATRCPKAYFSAPEDDGDYGSSDFVTERQKILEQYEIFKKSIAKVRERDGPMDSGRINARDHPSFIEVIQDDANDTAVMPFLVYVAREKRPSHHHNFKAGALNVLLRVSSVMSNSPFILGLDCDMYCNDPTSARQAMCFHLDSKISPSLSFVQFPQGFHNISKNDIHDSQNRTVFSVLWPGMDGLKGPVLSGTGFYIRRESLCASTNQQEINLEELKQSVGSSNELIKSFFQNYRPYFISSEGGLLKETELLASCTYDNGTKWGKEVGFLYDSVAEDFFTGFILHCKGWTSVFYDPSRPQFLGSGITKLNDLLIQGTRWSSGLTEVGFTKFSPFFYGPKRMPLPQTLCYAELTLFPFYCLPLWCFATIPQLCLLHGITLYPEVSNSYFLVFLFIFLSSISKHLSDVLLTGGSFQIWRNEQRIWMMKSITSHLYGSLDAIMKKLGGREASFSPTNKAADDEQEKLYQMGKFDFQTSNMFVIPMVTLIILNMGSFVVGLFRMISVGDWDHIFVQVFISFYILTINFPISEGMILRKDTGRVRPSATMLSTLLAVGIWVLGFITIR